VKTGRDSRVGWALPTTLISKWQIRNITWIIDDGTGRHLGWNYVAIGGNDYFQPYPNADPHEEWYTIEVLKSLQCNWANR
jgi:hypothetical protein